MSVPVSLPSRKVALRLGAVGIAAFGLYVLACRPAFSPDSRHILVTTVDSRASVARVLLFDRGHRDWEELLRLQGEAVGDSDVALAPSVGWSQDGRDAVITQILPGGEDVIVVALAVKGGEPPRLFRARDHLEGADSDEAAMLALVPPPIVGGRVHLGGARLAALDLASGDVQRGDLPAAGDDTPWMDRLVAQAGAVFGILHDPGGAWSICRIDPKSLEVTRIVISSDDLDDGAPLAVDPSGTRFALLRTTSPSALRIYDASGLRREVTLGRAGPTRVVDAAWRPDGAGLLVETAETAETIEDAEVTTLTLQEIDGDGRVTGTTRLLEIEGDPSGGPFTYQLAVAPDGSAVAVFADCILGEKLRAKHRGLYVADLRRPDRRVTFHPLPEQYQADGE